MKSAVDRRHTFHVLTSLTTGSSIPKPVEWSSEALWRQLLPLAELHRVTTFLPSAIKELGEWENVPVEIAKFLEAAAELNHARNQALLIQYFQIVDTLDQAGIPALPLKGLAYQLLGLHSDKPGRRMTIDIDVLVPLEEARKAQKLLVSAGYTPLTTDGTNELEHHNLPRLKPNPDVHGPGSIEVHFRVGRNETDVLLPVHDVFNTAEKIEVSGRTVLVPNLLHLLDHAVLHSGISHSYASRQTVRLRDADDISRLWTIAQSQGITVSDLRISKHKQASSYFGACLLLHRHPAETLGPLGPAASKMLARIVRRQAFAERPKLETAILSNARLLIHNPLKLGAKLLRTSFYQSARSMTKSPSV